MAENGTNIEKSKAPATPGASIFKWAPSLTPDQVEFTKIELMLKLVATVDPDGYPRITLITSNQAADAEHMKWGQFSVGLSKRNVHENPKQGLYYMPKDPPFTFFRAKALFERCSDEGEDAADFNKTSLMRYNTYMNVYRTFYSKLISAEPIKPLSIMEIARGIFTNLWAKWGAKLGNDQQKLPPWGKSILGSPFIPKFIALIDPADGYPVIIPAFQVRAVEWSRLIFPYAAFKSNLQLLTPGMRVAVLGLNLETMSMLIQGHYSEDRKFRGVRYGIIEIDKVYNSMPPKMGYIYPEKEVLPKVETFSLK